MPQLASWLTTGSAVSACCQENAWHAADGDVCPISRGLATWKADAQLPSQKTASANPSPPLTTPPMVAGAVRPLARAPPSASRVCPLTTLPPRGTPPAQPPPSQRLVSVPSPAAPLRSIHPLQALSFCASVCPDPQLDTSTHLLSRFCLECNRASDTLAILRLNKSNPTRTSCCYTTLKKLSMLPGLCCEWWR